jgi:hypothetical protein
MIDEIIKRVHNLTPEQQKDVLEYLNSMQASFKRGYPRMETTIEIDAVVGDKLIKSDVRDISGSGMFINTKWEIDIGKDVRVAFSLPGQDRPFKLQGKITRVEQSGIAIQFKEVSPYFQKILDGLIWKGK